MPKEHSVRRWWLKRLLHLKCVLRFCVLSNQIKQPPMPGSPFSVRYQAGEIKITDLLLWTFPFAAVAFKGVLIYFFFSLS